MAYTASDHYWFHAASLSLRLFADAPVSPHVSYEVAFRLADGVAAHVLLTGLVYTPGRTVTGGVIDRRPSPADLDDRR